MCVNLSTEFFKFRIGFKSNIVYSMPYNNVILNIKYKNNFNINEYLD